MIPIPETCTTLDTESSRALGVLSRWAARYAERRISLNGQESTKPDALIATTRARQLAAREKAFNRLLEFSWIRFLAGLFSLILVFSDIIRGGVGVSSLQKAYPALQPDQVLGFGSTWYYSVFSATKDEADSVVSLVWTYKFDSTSISWRAFGQHLGVESFPECLFYVEECTNLSLGGDTTFQMIDALVDAIANVNNSQQPTTGPVGLMLRTENIYIDRLHQFLLSSWFTNINWRTNQALYYSSELLAKISASGVCFPALGNRVKTPRFCRGLWTNLKYSCSPTDSQCQAVGLLYVHTMERLNTVQTRFPNFTVDLTFLESHEDMQVSRGGLSSLGFGRADVSTIIRARNCSGISCETIFVDEYRYETGLLTSDVVQWYRLVAVLRVTGQSYFWLRGIGLMLSCFFVYGNPNAISMWSRVRKARRLFMKVPTQCVVYGSMFPVTCYVLAHLIDAPYTYQVLESHFFSQAGVVDIKLESFISYAVVQMRSVWIYALSWQLVVTLSSHRGLTHANRLNSGVIGVPEFLLSAFSSVTLLAQYRMTSIRSDNFFKIMELPGNVGPAWEAVKYKYSFAHRGSGNRLLGGVLIDLKFLICFLFLVAALWAAHIVRAHFRSNEEKYRYSHRFLFPPTPVSYSAGVLWPHVSVCVQWTSDVYCIRNERNLDPELLGVVKKKQNRLRHPCLSRILNWKAGDGRVFALNFSTAQAKYTLGAEQRLHARAKRKHPDTYRYVQHQMECLHGRSDDVEAHVAYMNSVLLSDPLVYLRIILGSYQSTKLAYYQSIWRPNQVILLSVAVIDEDNEFSSGLKLLRRVNASELTWTELVQCG